MTRPYWSRVAQTRISRRRALAAGATLASGAIALPLVGCAEDAGAPEDDAPVERGGTLRFGTSSPLSYGLDPHLEQGGGLPIIARLYGYTHHVDPRDDSLILDHATSVEQVDPAIYVIRLAERNYHDASPANGRAVHGDDVVFSIRRYRDHPLVVGDWWHTQMLTAEGAPDPRTIIVTTKQPYADSLRELGQINAGAILPRESIDQQLDLRAGGAGSGPLGIGTVAAGGASPDRIRLERFDGYAPAPANVDAMEWRVFASDNERTSAFRERSVDVISCRDRREADDLESLEDTTIVEEPSLSWTSIGLRVDKAPMSDPRLREAIDIALDREELIAIASGGRGVAAGPVNPQLANGFWALPPAEITAAQRGDASIAARRTEGRQLLAAAGTPDAAIIMQVADVPELADLAGVIKSQLSEIGLTITIERIPLVTWYFNYRRGAFDATLISHPPYESPDAPLRLYHSMGIDGAGNQFGFSDLAIDALIERSWSEMARSARQDAVLRAQRQIIEARPLVHLFAGRAYTAARNHVRDSGLALPGSLSRYHAQQWLDLPVEGRPD